MSLGQRSRSQFALNLCAQVAVKPFHVWSLTLYCKVGFENNDTNDYGGKKCVACKNRVAMSDVNMCKSF